MDPCPEKPLLLAIDSDGCAFDTMRLKHERFFGPKLIEVFDLQACAEAVMDHWLRTNLYSANRGRNRFETLNIVLAALEGHADHRLPERRSFEEWLQSKMAKSNEALRQFKRDRDAPILDRVLDWSESVNEAIATGMPLLPPFPGVEETIREAAIQADLMVCSAANRKALELEWGEAALLKSVTEIGGQEAGTKSEQLQGALNKGYQPDNILMVGDSPGDRTSANENGIRAYPILPGNEADSWKQFQDKYWPAFLKGNFSDSMEDSLWSAYNRHLEQLDG
ncbi:MAG: HAD family hydrolase [Puniceicoccaceae bacterium]